MTKVDLKKSLDCYKAKSGVFQITDVPRLTYLMIDGSGDPNTSVEWSDAIATLYPVAYALKFMSKNELEQDYVVMPLEAQWWAEDMSAFTSRRDKTQWNWTAMIMVPEWTTLEMFSRSVETSQGKSSNLDFGALRMETLDEGLCVQTLHVGSYDDEGAILQQMHEGFIPGNEFELTGKHHEVYLSDARKTPPEKLRTILRQPVVKR